jgi:uncharacterized protein (UPF0261 family)
MSVPFLLTTLDTKGDEAGLVRDRLQQLGIQVTVVDTGCLGQPPWPADVTRQAVFQAAGADWQTVADAGDRGQAVTLAARGAAELVRAAFQRGEVDGVLAWADRPAPRSVPRRCANCPWEYRS